MKRGLVQLGRILRVGAVLVAVTFVAARADAQNFTLTINMVGPNPGTVGMIGPGGGLCSLPTAQCTFQVPSGAAIRLAANTLPGSVPGKFSAGSGPAASCALSSCSFTMTAAASVTATFDPANGPTSTVTVTLAGDGQGNVSFDNGRCQNFDVVSYSNCQAVYLQGSVVTHDVAPAAGSRFSGFSAGTGAAAACGTTNPCVYTITSNVSLTATFHALTSVAVSPLTASKLVGQSQTFIANGTYSNGVTEQIPFGQMGTWTTKAAMTTARSGMGVAAAGGKLYAIGGVTSGPLTVNEAYDPVANTWSTLAAMPTSRNAGCTAAVNGLIYVIGGLGAGGGAVAVNEQYDPGTNSWTARASMPTARGFVACGVINSVIYVAGGVTSSSSGTVLATVEAYDPAANTWTTKASLPAARQALGAGVVNGILYAVGGRDSAGSSVATTTAYDPAADAWTAKASMPASAAFLAVAVTGPALYAIGGSGSSVNQYDTARDAWSFKSGMPTSRNSLGAAVINGSIYAVGGQISNPATDAQNKLEVFTEHLRWMSTVPAVANVSQQGLSTTASLGTTTIAAAVGSVSCGTTTCAQFTVTTPPTMSIDKSSLQFAATSNGAAFVQQTGSQTVRLTQSGTGTVTWTATASQPWITVSPTSGTGTATLTIGVVRVSTLPPSGGVNGQVNLAFTGAANSSTPIAVALNIVSSTASGSPAGAFETPADGATDVSGSIALGGWAIDDVEVTRVRILRDPVTGETPGQQIFIGNGVFVDGARPDVAQSFPSVPRNTRAGWGYLLLTNFLPGQGNGTFKLYAYADDADGHTTLLGSRTITCDNTAAVRPFGAIDTPTQGETVSGTINNFGWVLSRGTRRADPPSGGIVNVLIDGINRGAPGAWGNRSDLSTLFPIGQYSGINNALGVFGFDTTTLANGLHTIAWIVTDNLGAADGVGSRYFTISNGSSLTADVSGPVRLSDADLSGVQLQPDRISGRHGFDLNAPLRSYAPDSSGRITIAGEELDRFELHLGTGEAGGASYAGYLRAGADLNPLPIGSHLEAATGIFTWQPGVAFVGPYDFTFVRSGGGMTTRLEVRIVLEPKGTRRVTTQIAIDTPGAGNGELDQPLVVAGWAADPEAVAGTGVSTVHVWAYPTDGGAPIFLGAAAYGGSRPDVAAVYGDEARASGYGLTVQGLEPGTYDLAVFAWSTAAGGFVPAKTVRITVR